MNVSLRTWGVFFRVFVDVEGGLPPVKAVSVMNINNSQTRRTSESIFLPGESRSPVRLDALRVLGLRLFIVLLKSKSLRKHRSLTRPHEETTTIAGYNCIGRFYRRFAIVRADSNFANDVNRGTSGSTTTPRLWESSQKALTKWHQLRSLCVKTTKAFTCNGAVLYWYANQIEQHSSAIKTQKNTTKCQMSTHVVFCLRSSCFSHVQNSCDIVSSKSCYIFFSIRK